MLIVLMDEPVLFVFASPEAAAVDIEPPDAESSVRAAFDEHAVPYRAEFSRPNRRRKVLGLVPVISFGKYQWVASGAPDAAALGRLIEQYPETDPPESRASLTALLNKLPDVL